MEISCPICDDNMEITNKVSSEYIDEISNDVKKDSDVTTTDQEIILQEEDFNNILDNNINEVKLTFKNFDPKELYKITFFNELDKNKQTLIINRIFDKINSIKNKSKSKQSDNIHLIEDKSYKTKAYFYCKSCGHHGSIPNKTLVFSRGNVSQETNNELINYDNYVSVYPTTKNYNCINKNCDTHKNPSMKNAVFKRIPGQYTVVYQCNVCEYKWNTSSEIN